MNMTKHKENRETLSENDLRFEEVIYLAGSVAHIDDISHALKDILESATYDVITQMLPGLPVEMLDSYDWEYEITQWLIDNNKLGFLVQVATPIRKAGDYAYSWNYYTTKWFYADSIDEVITLAIAWYAKINKLDTPAPVQEANTDVRTIMLGIEPGPDGMGVEVYAKSTKDVEDKLTELGSELEEWKLGIRKLPVQEPSEFVYVDSLGGTELAIRDPQLQKWQEVHSGTERQCVASSS